MPGKYPIQAHVFQQNHGTSGLILLCTLSFCPFALLRLLAHLHAWQMADGSGREMARKIVDVRGDRFVMNRGWNFSCLLVKMLLRSQGSKELYRAL